MNSSVRADEAPQVPRFTVTKFQVEGKNPLSKQKTRKILQPYVGEHTGLEGLLAARDALENTLIADGYSFHRVVLPPQTLKTGEVTIRVIQFTVGDIEIRGAKHFSNENILHSLPDLKSGATPNTKRLSRSLSIANDHPAKRVKFTFKESPVPDQVNALLEVNDRKPQMFFGSLNNTGTDETEDSRLSFGYQHTNLFNKDHILTLTHTTSPANTSKVSQSGINYRIPFYKMGSELSMYYVDSDVDSGEVANFFDVSGKGRFWGARYRQALLKRGRYKQDVIFGLDDKLFENDTLFFGLPIGFDVRSRPISATYQGTYQKVQGGVGFHFGARQNIESGSDNNDLQYTLTRFMADADWHAYTYGLYADHTFSSRWTFRFRLDGQVTNEPLIPGEQFGLGGATSVRGYEEREILADSGYFTTIEFWTPVIAANNLRVLFFYDHGKQDLEDPLPGQEDDAEPQSIGVGMRWSWRRNFSLKVDWARAEEDAGTTEKGDDKVHFNFIFAF